MAARGAARPIAVAICTNRTPGAIRPTLEAVTRQAGAVAGAEVLVVTSGLAEAEHEEHRAQAESLGARTVREPSPGLSRARNAAAAAAPQEGVVAFIDDDALPMEGWLERLSAHWREAGADIACIGGAILPRWLAPPPAWVSERVHPVLSLLDHGEGVVEMEPGKTDVWGANASFLVEPLQATGGFDPALGAYAGIPLSGDESLVQRRLADRGLRVLYAGDVRVEHCVPPERLRLREIARRRFYFGVVSATERRLGPIGGLGRALKAAAGLALAACTGRRQLAAERLARLSENAGVTMARPVRARLARRHGWPGRGEAGR